MKQQLSWDSLVKRQLTLNVLRAIIVLSIGGLLVQTYDFVNQLPLMDRSLQALPYLFESWFFGSASGYFSIYPAWYPLALIVLTIIGLRFKQQMD
jgi:hypothetical protein